MSHMDLKKSFAALLGRCGPASIWNQPVQGLPLLPSYQSGAGHRLHVEGQHALPGVADCFWNPACKHQHPKTSKNNDAKRKHGTNRPKDNSTSSTCCSSWVSSASTSLLLQSVARGIPTRLVQQDRARCQQSREYLAAVALAFISHCFVAAMQILAIDSCHSQWMIYNNPFMFMIPVENARIKHHRAPNSLAHLGTLGRTWSHLFRLSQGQVQLGTDLFQRLV